jgi:hypothetical protein
MRQAWYQENITEKQAENLLCSLHCRLLDEMKIAKLLLDYVSCKYVKKNLSLLFCGGGRQG